MNNRQEEINKQTLDAYLNEIRELRDTVKRLKDERVVLLGESDRRLEEYKQKLKAKLNPASAIDVKFRDLIDSTK